MRLNTRMLLEALEPQAEVVLAGLERPELNLRFPCFYEGDGEALTEGGVYLISPDLLPRRETQVLWVTWGPVPRGLPAGTSLLCFPDGRDPVRILNRIHSVFLRFQLWEDETVKILREDNSVKRLIESAEMVISRPLCAVDASLNHLGYNASFLALGYGTFFPEAEKHKMPELSGSALFCEPHSYIMSALGKQNGSLGALYMLENGTSFTYTEKAVFQQLAEKIDQALENTTVMSGLYQNAFKQQMARYFATGQVDPEKLQEALTHWGGSAGDTFEFYKVKASHLNQKVNADYICSIFESVLYATIAFWHKGALVVLVDVTRSGWTPEQIHGKMVDLVRQLHCRAGVSALFTDLDRAWNHYRQACCAFEEGYPADRNSDLYFFQDYLQSYILHHAVGEFPVADLLDSGLQALIDHDQLYSVSYLDTLRTYFRCEMNMSRTADTLGIHRTSLNSRIQKIFSILDHPLDSGYLLYLQIILAILQKDE